MIMQNIHNVQHVKHHYLNVIVTVLGAVKEKNANVNWALLQLHEDH